jgi:hypothetical protein
MEEVFDQPVEMTTCEVDAVVGGLHGLNFSIPINIIVVAGNGDGDGNANGIADGLLGGGSGNGTNNGGGNGVVNIFGL